MRLTMFFALLVATLAACGGQGAPTTGAQVTASPGGQPQATATSQPPPTPPPVVGGLGTSVAHVEIGSGELAGTYDATGEKVDCNTSSTGSGATFVDLANLDGLTSLTFSSGEGGASVDQFYFQVLFGEMGPSQPYFEIQTLDPANPRGSGTAQLEDKGATIKWTIDGVTEQDVAIKATIECGPVDRG